MKPAPRFVLRFCVIAVCSVVIATGCMLDRRPIFSSGAVTPAPYCPGDTLTASYDLLRGTPCTPRAGSPDECTTAAPNVRITSTPSIFPSDPIRAYSGSTTGIAPDVDQIAVNFDYGASTPTTIFIPPDRLPLIENRTVVARRYTGAPPESLTHTGACNSPDHDPVDLPGPPRLPPNLRLTRVCNRSAEAVMATLIGTAGQIGRPFMLAINGCKGMSDADWPPGGDNATQVDLEPLVPPMPPPMCGTTGGGDILPPVLHSEVTLACR